jgi:hypothetical protein
MHRALLVSLALSSVAGCAIEAEDEGVVLDPGSVLAGKADGDERLRAQFPPTRLVPGSPLAGWRLNHAVVGVDVDLVGLFSPEVQVSVPSDFFVEVGAFLLYDLPAGREVSLAVDTRRYGGEKMSVYVRRLPGRAEGRADGIYFPPGNSARFTVDPTVDPIADDTGTVVPGTSHYLLLVLPAQIRPGEDHVLVDLSATID